MICYLSICLTDCFIDLFSFITRGSCMCYLTCKRYWCKTCENAIGGVNPVRVYFFGCCKTCFIFLSDIFSSRTCYMRNNFSPICSFHTFCNCFCECGGSCGNCEFRLCGLGILYIYPFFAQAEHQPSPFTTPVVKILHVPQPLLSLVYWAHVIQICFLAFFLLG